MAKCKPGFKKVGDRCTKKSPEGLFRVFYEVPTNLGFDKADIKIFNSLPQANKEFNKRLTDLKKDVKNKDVEEGEGLILEDLNKDLRIESRIFDGDELQDYGGMR